MPSANGQPVKESRYTMAELVDLCRMILRFSRSVPPGPERIRHLQIAISLRGLFKNKAWLAAHTIEVGRLSWRPLSF
jgi:hypothetical protein